MSKETKKMIVVAVCGFITLGWTMLFGGLAILAGGIGSDGLRMAAYGTILASYAGSTFLAWMILYQDVLED